MNINQFLSLIEPYMPLVYQNLEYLLRIFLAMILGMLIGNERKNRHKSAGMRTHALVALGSALMMVVSKYGFYDSVQGDGARLAAQVVSGVGFLGAGMIFVRHNLVSGLTTAAGVWTTAGVGLTIGSGMYFVGIFSAVMMVVMQNVSHKIPFFANVTSSGQIRMTVLNKPGVIEELEQLMGTYKVEISGIQINKTEKDKIKLELDVIYPHKMDKSKLFYTLAEREDVVFLAE
jgi:putative Mg2+ transporter-C (MgtC) family protein